MFYKDKTLFRMDECKDTLALEIKTIVEKNKASFAFQAPQFIYGKTYEVSSYYYLITS